MIVHAVLSKWVVVHWTSIDLTYNDDSIMIVKMGSGHSPLDKSLLRIFLFGRYAKKFIKYL